MPRRNGAAVESKTGNVEASQRHDDAGIGFIAARKTDQSVKMIAARDELDRIRDHFTADKRALHPLHAHADAVGNRHGVELHGRAACCPDAFLDLRRKPP